MQKAHGLALSGCLMIVAGGLTPGWGWVLMIIGAVLLINAGTIFFKGRQ